MMGDEQRQYLYLRLQDLCDCVYVIITVIVSMHVCAPVMAFIKLTKQSTLLGR